MTHLYGKRKIKVKAGERIGECQHDVKHKHLWKTDYIVQRINPKTGEIETMSMDWIRICDKCVSQLGDIDNLPSGTILSVIAEDYVVEEDTEIDILGDN